METLKAVQIAKREWENIRLSLEECGDIGFLDYEKQLYKIGCSQPHGGLSLVKSLIEMDRKFPMHSYFTMDAAKVFAILASSAGVKLGLGKSLANKFGCGYSLVRTSSLDQNCVKDKQKHILKQLFFYKIFFPIGCFFNWDFNTPAVKSKLKIIFYMFTTWDKDPESYVQDVKEFGAQLKPLLRGLSIKLDTLVNDIDYENGYEYKEDECEIEHWIRHWV